MQPGTHTPQQLTASLPPDNKPEGSPRAATASRRCLPRPLEHHDGLDMPRVRKQIERDALDRLKRHVLPRRLLGRLERALRARSRVRPPHAAGRNCQIHDVTLQRLRAARDVHDARYARLAQQRVDGTLKEAYRQRAAL